MKKTLALLLALAMVLSLGGVAAAADMPAAVEITVDNWFVYFELADEPDPDADDDRIEHRVKLKDQYHVDKDTRYAMRDAMYLAGQYDEADAMINNKVTFTVAFNERSGACDEDHRFIGHPLLKRDEGEAEVDMFPFDEKVPSAFYALSYYDSVSSHEVTDPEVVAVTGTLYLTPEQADMGAAEEAAATPLPTATPRPASEPVEITPDNWGDYFEIAERRREERDDSGALEKAYLTYFIALKEPLIDLVDQE